MSACLVDRCEKAMIGAVGMIDMGRAQRGPRSGGVNYRKRPAGRLEINERTDVGQTRYRRI